MNETLTALTGISDATTSTSNSSLIGSISTIGYPYTTAYDNSTYQFQIRRVANGWIVKNHNTEYVFTTVNQLTGFIEKTLTEEKKK